MQNSRFFDIELIENSSAAIHRGLPRSFGVKAGSGMVVRKPERLKHHERDGRMEDDLGRPSPSFWEDIIGPASIPQVWRERSSQGPSSRSGFRMDPSQPSPLRFIPAGPIM